MDYAVRSSRSLTLVLLMAAVAALAACDDETGVLVEITRDPATTPEGMDQLEIVIGVQRSDNASRYVRDDSSIAELALGGRDLATSPYALLLRNGGADDARVMVGVVGKKAGQTVGFAGFTDPQPFIDGQILKRQLTLTMDPTFKVSDTGCLTWVGDTGRNQIASADDQDCDGDLAAVDCDDHDRDIGPSQTEKCGNQIDDNCNTKVDEETDDDSDGITNCEGDCDDKNAATHPGAEEICDGEDNDCNARCDDGALDADNDSFNQCGEKILDDGTCMTGVPADCNDGDDKIHPGATEICDGVDNDCDQTCDVGQGLDADGDGVTDCGTVPGTDPGQACLGPLDALEDCRDDDETVRPGAAEICDGKDDNCDGVLEQQEGCYGRAAGGGPCRLGSAQCDDDASGDGNFGLKDCNVADGGLVFPDSFCTAYTGCASDPTPFTCANDSQSTLSIECTLFHTGIQLCDERTASLPENDQASSCDFTVIGGKEQAHYSVGLVDRVNGGGAQPTVHACKADFVVLDKKDVIARPDEIYLTYKDNLLAPTVNHLHITPELVAQCPEKGLVCDLP
jgi:hypothetical protein